MLPIWGWLLQERQRLSLLLGSKYSHLCHQRLVVEQLFYRLDRGKTQSQTFQKLDTVCNYAVLLLRVGWSKEVSDQMG